MDCGCSAASGASPWARARSDSPVRCAAVSARFCAREDWSPCCKCTFIRNYGKSYMANPRIIIVGGGLAGLMAAIRTAEHGMAVDLFSIVPVKRSHSVCAQGGINAAKNTKGEGDSTWKHFDDTVYGGDFLANQPPIDRKSTRLNSSHLGISYAVFCL